MDREQAILKYREETRKQVEDYRVEMLEHLLERAQQLEDMVKHGMDQLGDNIQEMQKEYVSFFYMSMLKTDLVNRKYRFLLHAMNFQWYLDEELVEVYVDAGDLFEPLSKLWDHLIEESRRYMGVINQYDIQHMLFDELKVIDSTISRILRYRLRDWEKKEIFSNVPLSPYWFLKWGEYRDQTEFIIQTDRVVKEKHVWKEELKKAAHKPETMIFSYWYQGDCEESQIEKLEMMFMVFEECRLVDLKFWHCNLEGSRFTSSSLCRCSFEECNLCGADFTGCSFEQVSFLGSQLTGALFPADSIPFLTLDPEQLQTVLIKREEK